MSGLLRYSLVGATGVILVAWGVSVFFPVCLHLVRKDRETHIILHSSELVGYFQPLPLVVFPDAVDLYPMERAPHTASWQFFGHLHATYLPESYPEEGGYLYFHLPIPIILTSLIPLVIGSFTGFRFRLWQWSVYVAIFAAEFAYYLHWQD